MKSKKTKQEPAVSSPKGKVKIKTLKLDKETVGNLSDQDAGAIKGGGSSLRPVNHNETFVCEGED